MLSSDLHAYSRRQYRGARNGAEKILTMLRHDFSLHVGDTILAINPGHDGAVVAIKDRKLLFSREAEHDSHPRHIPSSAGFLLNVMKAIDDIPAVIARSGWSNDDFLSYESPGLPYHGVSDDLVRLQRVKVLGQPTTLVESTHERAHIFCSYGLSPFPEGEPFYALVWEGEIGAFYEVDEKMRIVRHGPILSFPGYKYSFLYDLADPSTAEGKWRHDTAGKLMALAAFSKRSEPTEQEMAVINQIFRDVVPPITSKAPFKNTPYYNCGVMNPEFQNLVAMFSNALFDRFYTYAKQHLTLGLPLVISGGCGLNCEWNSRWRDSKLFADVFVPPVPNDCGIAIGTAIEAQYLLSGAAKVSWNVYSGDDFVWDSDSDNFVEADFDADGVIDLLLQDKVIAWVHGRTEIGPRALGNRSLIAAPFKRSMTERLNAIKQREWYRPIAPVCLEEDATRLFGMEGSSPHMLYFQQSCAPELQAVMHVDGSARVQTVNASQNRPLYRLLNAFKKRTGFGVLCNTSLNRQGKGFINRSSELFAFTDERKIDAAVVDSRLFVSTGQAQDATASVVS